MSERLRHTGVQAVTFHAPGVGWVEPGGEFDAPPGMLLSFMRRPDIEHAGECPFPPCRCGEEPRPESESGTAKPARAKAPKAPQNAAIPPV